MWTRFMDMHSGGGQKLDWSYIYIEAPEEEAEIIFYNRFGRNPERVTCTCCGPDYSISSHDSLQQLTGYDRGCRNLETPRDPKTGLYLNDDPVIKTKLYLEKGEKPPEGYKVDKGLSIFRDYQTLEKYLVSSDVHVIYADQIRKEDRLGDVPEEGYVWQ